MKKKSTEKLKKKKDLQLGTRNKRKLSILLSIYPIRGNFPSSALYFGTSNLAVFVPFFHIFTNFTLQLRTRWSLEIASNGLVSLQFFSIFSSIFKQFFFENTRLTYVKIWLMLYDPVTEVHIQKLSHMVFSGKPSRTRTIFEFFSN